MDALPTHNPLPTPIFNFTREALPASQIFFPMDYMDLPFDLIPFEADSMPRLRELIQATKNLLSADEVRVRMLGEIGFARGTPAVLKQMVLDYLNDENWQDEALLDWEMPRENSLWVESVGKGVLEVDLEAIFIGPPWEESEEEELEELIETYGSTLNVQLVKGSQVFLFPNWTGKGKVDEEWHRNYDAAQSIYDLELKATTIEEVRRIWKAGKVLFGEGFGLAVSHSLLVDARTSQARIELINEYLGDIHYRSLEVVSVGTKWMRFRYDWGGEEFEFLGMVGDGQVSPIRGHSHPA